MIDYSQLMVVVYVSEEKHGTVERKFTAPCFLCVSNEATYHKNKYFCESLLSKEIFVFM